MIKKIAAILLMVLFVLTGCTNTDNRTNLKMDFTVSDEAMQGEIQETDIFISESENSLHLTGYAEVNGTFTLKIVSADGQNTEFDQVFETIKSQNKQNIKIDINPIEPGHYKIVVDGLLAKSVKVELNSSQSLIEPHENPSKPEKPKK